MGEWLNLPLKYAAVEQRCDNLLKELENMLDSANFAPEILRKHKDNDYSINSFTFDQSKMVDVHPDGEGVFRLPLEFVFPKSLRPKKRNEMRDEWAKGGEITEIGDRKIAHPKTVPIW